MKKYIIAVFACILIMFSACSNDANNNNNANEPENNNTEEVPGESDNTDENKELNDENDSENETNDGKTTDQQNNDEQTDMDEDIADNPEPAYEVNFETWSIDPIDEANEKVALVTIDDAPDKYALEMANTLKDLDVNAIFFVNGHFLETDEKKDILKEIYDMGFMIGNHTYSHQSLPDLSEEEQKEEITSVNDMVEEIIGERPLFFRAPFGENTDYSKQLAEEEGMTLMNWSYGYDWEADYQTEEAITDIMINTELLRDGANMLMHDREWTNAGLHDIVTGLQEKGYEMVDPKLIKTKADE